MPVGIQSLTRALNDPTYHEQLAIRNEEVAIHHTYTIHNFYISVNK